MTTDAMTPHHVLELFGDKVRKHANLISAIYAMHHAFALKQTIFAKPELRVEELEHTDDYTVTVRGGLGVDTRALTSTKLQEVKFDAKINVGPPRSWSTSQDVRLNIPSPTRPVRPPMTLRKIDADGVWFSIDD